MGCALCRGDAYSQRVLLHRRSRFSRSGERLKKYSMANTGEAPKQSKQSSLKRVIGRRMLLFFVLGDILGAGIYVLVGRVAGHVGGMLWLPFLLAFVLAVLTAAAYSELAGKYSQAAGAALYVNKAFKIPFVTFIVAFG